MPAIGSGLLLVPHQQTNIRKYRRVFDASLAIAQQKPGAAIFANLLHRLDNHGVERQSLVDGRQFAAGDHLGQHWRLLELGIRCGASSCAGSRFLCAGQLPAVHHSQQQGRALAQAKLRNRNFFAETFDIPFHVSDYGFIGYLIFVETSASIARLCTVRMADSRAPLSSDGLTTLVNFINSVGEPVDLFTKRTR